MRKKVKEAAFSFEASFWGRTYGGIRVSAFKDAFAMSGEDEARAAESFKSLVTANQKELEDLLMDFFFEQLNPDEQDEQSVIDGFKPETLFVREDGDFVLWGFGYEFGDEGFALVVGSQFEVTQQSEYLTR